MNDEPAGASTAEALAALRRGPRAYSIILGADLVLGLAGIALGAIGLLRHRATATPQVTPPALTEAAPGAVAIDAAPEDAAAVPRRPTPARPSEPSRPTPEPPVITPPAGPTTPPVTTPPVTTPPVTTPPVTTPPVTTPPVITPPEPTTPPVVVPPAAPDAGPPDASPAEVTLSEQELADAVGTVVTRHASQVKRCWTNVAKASGDDNAPRGTIVVAFTVLPDGRAETVFTVSNDTQSPELAECLVAAITRWRFPSHAGGPVALSWPFRFEAQGP